MKKFVNPFANLSLDTKADHLLATAKLAAKRVYDAVTGVFAKVLKLVGLQDLAPAFAKATLAILVLQVVVACPALLVVASGILSFAFRVIGLVVLGVAAKKASRFFRDCSAQVAEQEKSEPTSTAHTDGQ